MDNQVKNKICIYPFWHAEIDVDGNVSCCCPDFTDFYFLGNIFEEDNFKNIWNGEKWNNFREDIKNGKYTKCKLEMCYGLDDTQFVDIKNIPKRNLKTPKFVTLSMDPACNVKCIFCRDKKHFLNKEETDRLIKKIDNFFIPMLKNTEIITLNGAGEVFSSKFCKTLIEKATEKYPKIKFDIFTNGLLCNEKILKLFNLLNRLNAVTVSLHATTKKTYNSIIQGSDFNKVISNIEYLSQMKKDKKIENLALTFVVTSLNYQELPAFVELAAKYNAYPNIWPVRPYNECDFCHNIDKYDITKKNHPKHKDFLEVLKNPIFKKHHILINGQITNLFEE